jgi:hypothetical protein
MDKTITTALLIIISMVMALMLFNAAYPAIIQGGDAISSMANQASEQLRSQIKIIHAAAELNNEGRWQDSDGNSKFDVFVWVKNLGNDRIVGADQLDVFFGPEGNFARIPPETDGGLPTWTSTLENASDWTPTATLKVDIRFGSPLSSGRYFIQITTPTGVTDQSFLGM